MIHYQLRCAGAHEFDGWFKNSAAFDAQIAQGLLTCPSCGRTEVVRALMAPRIGVNAKPPRSTPVPAPDAKLPVAGGSIPDTVRFALQKLRAEVERHCDYVGPNFAAEARRIHDGQVAPRGIYGESTEAQAEALADDGIEVSRIPWLPPSDS